MKKDSKFFKYFILTNPGSLSMKERIILILIPSIFIFCCAASVYTVSHDFIVWVLLLGVYVFFAGLALPLIFFEKYDEKYGFNSKIRFGGTYQFISKNFSLLLPGLVMIILTVGFILNDFFKSLLISFAFLLPFLALFFRIDVFNDNSSIENDEIILGYNPGYYGLLSLCLGILLYDFKNLSPTEKRAGIMDGRIHRESLLHEAYENYLSKGAGIINTARDEEWEKVMVQGIREPRAL